MDELDIKIMRSLISESAISPSISSVRLSLRGIAARIGADDMTVSNRYKKLMASGCMSIWTLLVNPSFFGCDVSEVLVDTQSESEKPDIISRLKEIDEITGMVDFFGKGISIYLVHEGDDSRDRTLEAISKITGAEEVVLSNLPMPPTSSRKLSHTEMAIIRSLSSDARKPAHLVAAGLGLSAKTVRKYVDRLRREYVILPLPILNLASIPGAIPVYLSYGYAKGELKSSVDRELLSHFDWRYLMGNFANSETANIVITALTMSEVPGMLEWAKSRPGISRARLDIATETFMFPEKLIEKLGQGSKGVVAAA